MTVVTSETVVAQIVLRSILFLLAILWGKRAVAEDIFNDPTVDDVPTLISTFSDPNLRLGASRAIESVGAGAVPNLVQALRSDQDDLRIWSAYTLGRLGPKASAAVTALADLFPSSNVTLRRVATRSLGEVHVDDAVVIELLAKLTSDDDVRVRQYAVDSLGQIGPSANAATGQLIDALDDQPVRARALESLVNIGELAIPLLEKELSDDTIRMEVAEALRRIDPESAKRLGVAKTTIADLVALEISLHDQEKDLDARIQASEKLGKLGLEAAPMLISVFADENQSLTESAAHAFGKMGRSAVPVLRETLQNHSPAVRKTAIDAVAAIGPDAEDATADVVVALADDDRNVRHHAVKCARSIRAATDDIVLALIEVMQDPREQEATRQLAVKTLAQIAPRHEKTTAAFRESTKDRNYGVSSLVKEMLRRLDFDD